MDKWPRILNEQNVIVGLRSERRFDALREVSKALVGERALFDFERFVATLINREKQNATCIGKGVAVPHVHEDFIKRQVLAVGISAGGIDFKALDGEPVQILAVLATPKKHRKQHMESLAALSRFLQHRDTHDRLVKAKTAAEIMDVFS